MAELRQLTVAYLGNHVPKSSTETHVAASFEALGCRVARIQEGDTPATEVPSIVKAASADMFLHTQTYGLALTAGTDEERHVMVQSIKNMGIPTVGFHLDLWWGLDREKMITQARDAFFALDFLFTADGGNDDKWAEYDINHHWLPPGVYHAEAHDGQYIRAYASDVGFVGSHQHYGHEEHWPVRRAMLDATSARYGRRFNRWPRRAAVRGEALNNLYASIKVVIGDSCLAGKLPRYWSDRIPETLGRGGFLIHPDVPGLQEVHPFLVTYPPEDWDAMLDLVEFWLTNDEEREMLRKSNAEHTRENHTYHHRAQTILDIVLP